MIYIATIWHYVGPDDEHLFLTKTIDKISADNPIHFIQLMEASYGKYLESIGPIGISKINDIE